MNKNIPIDDFITEYTDDPKEKVLFEQEKARQLVAYQMMKAREKAGLSQRQLAEKADVPQRTIVRVEHGANTSIDTMSKIAIALGKSVTIVVN